VEREGVDSGADGGNSNFPRVSVTLRNSDVEKNRNKAALSTTCGAERRHGKGGLQQGKPPTEGAGRGRLHIARMWGSHQRGCLGHSVVKDAQRGGATKPSHAIHGEWIGRQVTMKKLSLGTYLILRPKPGGFAKRITSWVGPLATLLRKKSVISRGGCISRRTKTSKETGETGEKKYSFTLEMELPCSRENPTQSRRKRIGHGRSVVRFHVGGSRGGVYLFQILRGLKKCWRRSLTGVREGLPHVKAIVQGRCASRPKKSPGGGEKGAH